MLIPIPQRSACWGRGPLGSLGGGGGWGFRVAPTLKPTPIPSPLRPSRFLGDAHAVAERTGWKGVQVQVMGDWGGCLVEPGCSPLLDTAAPPTPSP